VQERRDACGKRCVSVGRSAPARYEKIEAGVASRVQRKREQICPTLLLLLCERKNLKNKCFKSYVQIYE